MKKFCKSALVIGLFGVSAQLFAFSSANNIVCPADYQPTLCTYGEFSAEGGNRCWASVSLQTQLKANGIAYDSAAITCVNNDVQLLRSLKPACGIVHTTTYCSVIVNEVKWEETASSCDSPVPELKARLSLAGIDTKGLVLSCEREQFGLDGSRFEITL